MLMVSRMSTLGGVMRVCVPMRRRRSPAQGCVCAEPDFISPAESVWPDVTAFADVGTRIVRASVQEIATIAVGNRTRMGAR